MKSGNPATKCVSLQTNYGGYFKIQLIILRFAAILCLMTLLTFAANVHAADLKVYCTDTSNIPLTNLYIELHPTYNDSLYGDSVYRAMTNSSGTASIDSIPPKEYQIKISTSDQFPEQWYSPYGNTLYPQYKMLFMSSATYDSLHIKVISNPINNSGTSSLTVYVVDSTGNPVSNSSISIIRETDRATIDNMYSKNSPALFSGLQPGYYAIQVCSSPFPCQTYDTSHNSSSTKYFFPIITDESKSVTVTLTMLPSGDGAINGTIFNESSAPVSGLTVSLFRDSNFLSPAYIQTTSQTGEFAFNNIFQTSYHLKISGGTYPDQWYSKELNATTTNPGVPLWSMPSMYNSINVFVTSSPIDNKPTSVVKVRIYNPEGQVASEFGKIALVEIPSYRYTTMTIDSSALLYISPPQKESHYSLGFDIPGYPYQYYHPQGNTFNNSYQFALGKNETLFVESVLKKSTIDTQTTTSYAYVSGTVYGSGGTIAGAVVSIFEKNGRLIQKVLTDSIGTFKPIPVPSSVLYLSVEAPKYPQQYWTESNGQPTASVSSINYFTVPTQTTMTTDLFLINDPQTIIDSTFDRSIEGSVRSISGTPLSNIRVALIQSDELQFGFSPQNIWSHQITYTDGSGVFTFNQPPLGNYLIAAIADSANFVTQFHKMADIPQNATLLTVGTQTVSGISFILRRGGIVTGSIVNENGSPVSQARVSLHEGTPNGRHYETISMSDGSWKIQGVAKGEWYTSVNHDLYIQKDFSNNIVNVIEGSTVTTQPLKMELGGVISGIVSLPSTIAYTDIKGSLSLYPLVAENNDIFNRAIHRTYIQFYPDNSTSGVMRFTSGVCPAGTYKLIFTPDIDHWTYNSGDTLTDNSNNFGYSFFNGASSLADEITVTITRGDTVKGNILNLREGSSIGAIITGEGTPLATEHFDATVFVLSGDQYYDVCSGFRLDNGVVELPGLIDGEQYFIRAWAEGYPDQFWSPTGMNSTYPKDMYTFSSSQSSDIQIDLLMQPEGHQVDINQYISAWLASEPGTAPTLKWTVSPKINIEKMFIYSRNESVLSQIVTEIPYTPGTPTYDWTDSRILTSQIEYCIVGQGKDITVRSDRIMFDIRKNDVSRGNIWIDVHGNRHGIEIKWGLNDTIQFTEQDTAVLFKRTLGGTFREIERKNAYDHYFFDHEWDTYDSLKTFEYKVTIPSLGKYSSEHSFTLSAEFFAGLAKEFRVGPGEQFSKIQDAIDAAGEFDMISVHPGIYREQLNFKGKTLNLYGQMHDGELVTIDASGGTAITIPYIKTSSIDNNGAFIYGFKLTNAYIGIETYAPIHIDRCLFTNMHKGISLNTDSANIALSLQSNPFADNHLFAYVQNSTFIASEENSFVAYVRSHGTRSATTNTDYNHYNEQLIQPLKSISSHIEFHRTLFAYYKTVGNMTSLPVYCSDDFSSARVANSAAWQTTLNSMSGASVSFENNNVSYDPQFKDTISYFTGDSSVIRSLRIGFSDDYYGEDNYKDQRELTAIANLVIFNRAIDKIELRWDPSPLTDSIVRYRIYRLPGDESLFYVNNESFWDITMDDDELFSIMDTFSTEKTWFIDNTVKAGAPYLYVVCGVDANDNESEVRIPASKPIRSYFSNVAPHTLKIQKDQWSMISPWGQSGLSFGPSTTKFIYQWDPNRESDKLLSHYAPVESMKPGNGYWFKSLSDTMLYIASSEPIALQSVQDTLRCKLYGGGNGWNQIASPFPFPVNPKLPLHYVLWDWDVESKGYKRVSMMEPWKSYWVHSIKDTSFIINSGENYPRTIKTLSKRSSMATWELQLSLKSSNGNDPENIFGVIATSPNKIDNFNVPEPPQPFGGDHIYFVKKLSKTTASNQNTNLSYHYLESDPLPDEPLEWQVGITSTSGTSLLSFNGIESCPRELELFWIYNGTITNLRETATVSIESSKSETFGYIIATARPIDFTLYSSTFSLRAPYPNPSAGNVTIDYIVPYKWTSNGLKSGNEGFDISIVLYDLSGKKIKSLLNAKKTPGKYKLFWNGTSQSGHSLGAGVYILQFKSGDFVKNVQMFRVR